MSYQQLTLAGNVGREVELRYLNDGTPIASFSVATSTGYGDKKRTTWFKVTAWRQLAETCNQYVYKGMQVLVTGEVKADAYVGKDGTARAELVVTARDVKFLSKREGVGSRVADGQDIPF